MLRLFTFILTFTLLTTLSNAQEENPECVRLKVAISYLSGNTENWKEATTHFIKAEAACDNFGKDNYNRLLTCVQHVIAQEVEGPEDYYSYLDTLMWVWERAEENDCYDATDDLTRGYHYTLLKTPDCEKADFFISRASKVQGAQISNDSLQINEIQYNIAACYMQRGSYTQAFNAAKRVTGDLKPKAVQIQAGCVAATANTCGDSTFERKCNYLYAAALMEEAGLDGSRYRSSGPVIEYATSNHDTITLICWGVTIDLATGEVVSEE